VALPRRTDVSPDLLVQSAFDQAAIGMALVDLNGRWLRVNRAVCELVGYNEEELRKLRFQDITHPEDVGVDVENADKLRRGEIARYEIEKRYLHRKGNVVWGLLSVSLVRGSDQKPLFFISQIQDITARKEGEEKLLAAAAEIKELRKGLLTVCAWTKRIQVDGRWVEMDEFLSQNLHLNLTHGMSEEAVRLFGKNQSPK
jgi:PAS domain S-box-containing protein